MTRWHIWEKLSLEDNGSLQNQANWQDGTVWCMLKSKGQGKEYKEVYWMCATKVGEWLYLDTMGPFEPSLGRSCNHAKIVDQFSQKSWDRHLKSKDQIYNPLKTHLIFYKAKGLLLSTYNAIMPANREEDLWNCAKHVELLWSIWHQHAATK